MKMHASANQTVRAADPPGPSALDAGLCARSIRAMHRNDTAWPRNHGAVRHITVTVRVFPTPNPVRNRASFDRMTT